jgi:hypothetical protein
VDSLCIATREALHQLHVSRMLYALSAFIQALDRQLVAVPALGCQLQMFVQMAEFLGSDPVLSNIRQWCWDILDRFIQCSAPPDGHKEFRSYSAMHGHLIKAWADLLQSVC